MRKYRMIIIVMVLSLMLVGAAYGEWSQMISVVSRISTGSLSGDVVYESGKEDVSVDEDNFHDTYEVEVVRSGVLSNHVNDTITFKNKGSVPGKFQKFRAGDVSVSAVVQITTKTKVSEVVYAADGSELTPAVYEDTTGPKETVILSAESSAKYLEFSNK